MVPTTVLHTRDGKLDACDQPKLDALKTRIAGKSAQILLHLHGGLVATDKGDELAARLSGHGPHAFNAPNDWEQIYVVWRTGFLETIRANWTDLAANDRIYNALLKRLLGYLSGKLRIADGPGRSVGAAMGLSPAEIEARLRNGDDAPFGDVDAALRPPPEAGRGLRVDATSDLLIRAEFQTALQLDPEFTGAVEDLDAALNPVRAGRGFTTGQGNEAAGRRMLQRLDPHVREALAVQVDTAAGRAVFTSAALLGEMVKHGVTIVRSVIGRFRAGRDHGFHATIVEELARELYGDLVGAAVWGMMKKDGFDHFLGGRLGPQLVEALSGAAGARLRVTAHSAGAIWATALLDYIADQKLDLDFDVVFLAPAVRVDAFGQMLQKAEARIQSFRIFAMSDVWEASDPVLGPRTGAIYPASLLYLVSGLFEERDGAGYADAPILGMQRFFPGGLAAPFVVEPDEITELVRAAAFFGRAKGEICFSPSAPGAPQGLHTQSRSHGDFDNDAETLASARFFLL